MWKRFLISVILLSLISILASCAKSTTEPEVTLSQPSTGAISPILQNMGLVEVDVEDSPLSTPAPDHVFVVLNNMQIRGTAGNWVTVPTSIAPFDLISIGENPTMYTSQSVVAGSYDEISFNITSISVQIGSQSYNATVPESTNRLVGSFEVANDKTTVVDLDFEADQSLSMSGNNQYVFKPDVEFRTPKPGGVLGITTTGLANSLVGINVWESLSVSGGTSPYTFSVTSGSLPSGITLNPKNGSFEGSPTQAGTYNFVIQVSDSSSPMQTDTASYTIRIGPVNSIINETSYLPNGIVNEAYYTQLNVLGGNGVYTWKTLSGSLPPGLILSVSAGTISGTPSQSGTYSITIQVQDGSSPPLEDIQTFTLVIQ